MVWGGPCHKPQRSRACNQTRHCGSKTRRTGAHRCCYATEVSMSTILLILATLIAPQTNPPKGNAESGKALFMKIGCFECHGREGQGAVTGPRLNQNPITYTRFVSYIRKPSGEMPPYTAKVVNDHH